MTCPDWKLLVARRDGDGRDPDGWGEALDHMDRCEACRRSALAADPTLVFRRLPRVGSTAADVESMRSAVASLRRASRVGALDGAGRAAVAEAVDTADDGKPPRDRAAGPARPGGRIRFVPSRSAFARAAAALLLAVAGFAVWIAGGDDLVKGAAGDAAPAVAAALPEASPPGGASLHREPDSELPAEPPAADSPSADDLAARPVFEGLSRPRAADVYQVGDEDLLVVMVVDETLDI